MRKAVLIDLSSIAHPLWHVAQADPDPNKASREIAAKVRGLAQAHPYAAVCCDSGRSFRYEISQDYKANRPTERDATFKHQVELAIEQIRLDGFPIWAVPGFEADDLLATACLWVLEHSPEDEVLLVTADKDLLQLVQPRVTAVSPMTGVVMDEAGVKLKFGVEPTQIRDWLGLVGDKSDNVVGAKGIGEKTAAKLLGEYVTVDLIAAALQNNPEKFSKASTQSLSDFFANTWPTTRRLLDLRTDVPLPLHELFVERVQQDAPAAFSHPFEEEPVPDDTPTEIVVDEPIRDTAKADAMVPFAPEALGAAPASRPTALVPFAQRLEPRSLREAQLLAQDLFASRFFATSGYGNPQAVLAVMMAGAELGMTSMRALRAFDIIEGKPHLKADALRALVLQSPLCEYLRCTKRTAQEVIFETKRRGDPPVTLTYTIEEATVAGRVKAGSAYTKDPADMLVARASSKLARLVFPDVIHGLIATEELDA